MKSFRSEFAPVIASTIKDHKGQSLAALKKALRAKWRNDIRTSTNNYMQSAWSKEVRAQLANHPEYQKNIKELPLFKEMA